MNQMNHRWRRPPGEGIVRPWGGVLGGSVCAWRGLGLLGVKASFSFLRFLSCTFPALLTSHVSPGVTHILTSDYSSLLAFPFLPKNCISLCAHFVSALWDCSPMPQNANIVGKRQCAEEDRGPGPGRPGGRCPGPRAAPGPGGFAQLEAESAEQDRAGDSTENRPQAGRRGWRAAASSWAGDDGSGREEAFSCWAQTMSRLTNLGPGLSVTTMDQDSHETP